MALTTAQKATLKAAVLADATLNAFPNTSDGNFDLALKLNAVASPAFKVWNNNTQTSNIFDAILWDRYTPTDAADSTVLQSNRILMVQTKQMNLQNMLVGRDTIDAGKANVRAGLRDAVIQLPTGTAGALVSAGGANAVTVLNACVRDALLIEKIFTAGPATTGGVTADTLGRIGQISPVDVTEARNS